MLSKLKLIAGMQFKTEVLAVERLSAQTAQIKRVKNKINCFSHFTLIRVKCEEMFCKTNIKLLKL